MKARIKFTEPLLGTLSGNKEIAEEYINSKHPEGHSKEESEMHPDEELEKSSTIFARDGDKLMLWDYQFKGFFKEACEQMINSGTMTKEELKGTNNSLRLTQYLYKKTIDKQIFVMPRKICLELPEGMKPEFTERPLRGQTMRGERICLARSESVPAGTSLEIEVVCLNTKLEPYIKQWLTFGALFGMGQWRTSGMGRFKWEEKNNKQHLGKAVQSVSRLGMGEAMRSKAWALRGYP